MNCSRVSRHAALRNSLLRRCLLFLLHQLSTSSDRGRRSPLPISARASRSAAISPDDRRILRRKVIQPIARRMLQRRRASRPVVSMGFLRARAGDENSRLMTNRERRANRKRLHFGNRPLASSYSYSSSSATNKVTDARKSRRTIVRPVIA